MKAALIDNYDSFTYNLCAQLVEAGFEVKVFRNDKVSLAQLEAFDVLAFSPGPGVPSNAGIMLEIIEHFAQDKPMLGVCLGMQAIAEVFGGSLKLLSNPLHGISRAVHHSEDTIFSGLDDAFAAARYHSWVVDAETLPTELQTIAKAEDEEIMALKHIYQPIYGFQFHPESVLTDQGLKLIENFKMIANTYYNEKVNRQAI